MALFLPKTLAAWQKDDFKQIAKAEIERLDGKLLPLQAGLSHSTYALTDKFSAIVYAPKSADTDFFRASISYSGIIAGCSCANDPTPVDEITEFIELKVLINKETAEAEFKLI